MKKAILFIMSALVLLSLTACRCEKSVEDTAESYSAKPVIYLYPTEETEVTVNLEYNGNLTATYPESDGTWTVTAMPDGTILCDGKEYNYIYWEGETDVEYDFSTGFCVKGSDTAKFLETVLDEIGLNRREANEFIVYWLPILQENEYNVISFQTDVYEENAKLTISPEPDNILRVFMAWYPSEKYVEIPEQTFPEFTRDGFTVVEWGGSLLK
jgi:hypothetical protein